MTFYGYKIFKDEKEFIDWQKENYTTYQIINISPILNNIEANFSNDKDDTNGVMQTNVEIFVTYSFKKS